MATATNQEFDWEDHARGAIYGNAIGYAIGQLTEFMSEDIAAEICGHLDEMEFQRKAIAHRSRKKNCESTSDINQMYIIMNHSLSKNGEVNPWSFSAALLALEYMYKGVHEESEGSGCQAAPKGGVMRTSVLGVHRYQDLDTVVKNTLTICKVTNADHRCQASCVAATTAIAMMLQRSAKHVKADGSYDVEAIRQAAYERAKKCLPQSEMHQELKDHMFVEDLSSLKLMEPSEINYTYKCLGTGFWAFMQEDFRKALTTITMEAGEADTNGAVAGAMLGCKLGAKALPDSWLNGLWSKSMLDKDLDRFLQMQK